MENIYTVEILMDLVKDYANQLYLTSEESESPERLKQKEQKILDALTTLTQHHQAELAEVYREIQTADQFQGFPVIISNDPDNKDYCDGFVAGVKFLKERIQALALTRGIDISDKTDTNG